MFFLFYFLIFLHLWSWFYYFLSYIILVYFLKFLITFIIRHLYWFSSFLLLEFVNFNTFLIFDLFLTLLRCFSNQYNIIWLELFLLIFKHKFLVFLIILRVCLFFIKLKFISWIKISNEMSCRVTLSFFVKLINIVYDFFKLLILSLLLIVLSLIINAFFIF